MSFLNRTAALAARQGALRRRLAASGTARQAGHAPHDDGDPDRPEDEDCAPEHDKT